MNEQEKMEMNALPETGFVRLFQILGNKKANPPIPTHAGLDLYHRKFTSKTGAARRSLEHGSLPTSFQYLNERGLMNGKARGAWAATLSHCID